MLWCLCNDRGEVFSEGDYQKCVICEDVFEYDEITDGVCNECLKELVARYKYDIAKCYDLSKKNAEKHSVDIDYFLSCMFTEEQINEVLYRELAVASAIMPVDCTNFIEADRYWFDERVIEEVKKNDNR
jgi:hypothetical protein